MRILGIDPGYAIMGWGVIEKKGNSVSTVAYGAVTTEKDMPMPDRLKVLYSSLMEIIAEYQPDEVSIEELYFHTNQKTVIFVGQARGVAILACSNSSLPIYEYTPLQIKTSITGNGRAEKKQVQEMVKRILGLSEVPKPDDTADAIAAAICHSYVGELNKKLSLLK
ncbi:MAG: crossover junction endodeoxyribonuclease RuvC [Clostridia bacterium]|nr:crossover junction endodeoxyribonuclease RuvC [Clostridia bacterium]